MVSRKSPAKVEGEAREAAAKARESALGAGKSEEEASAAAVAAADAVRKGTDESDATANAGADTKTEDSDAKATGAGAGDRADDNLLETVIPDDVAAAIAKDQRRGALDRQERALLAEACYVFGLDPDPTLKPREVLSYRFDAGDPNGATPIPPYVSIVTGGGVKIRYPIDDDTEARLRQVYNCFRINPRTGERDVLPLPPDLTLPKEAVDGQVRTAEHQYRTGYLREGGKTEADRRQKLDELRRQGRIR